MFLIISIILLFLLLLGALVRWRWRHRRRLILSHQLRTWVAHQDTLDPAIRQWILELPEAEAQVLLTLLSGYCTSLNWELRWLFAPQLEKAPVLKATLEESVSAYVRAILLSLQLEADVQAYQAYLAFEKKPTSRKQRPLTEQLYEKISRDALIPPTKRLFSRFSRKEVTLSQQVATIQQAFERKPAEAMELLAETLSGDAVAVVK